MTLDASSARGTRTVIVKRFSVPAGTFGSSRPASATSFGRPSDVTLSATGALPLFVARRRKRDSANADGPAACST